MSDTVSCPFCQAEIPDSAQKCRHCGEWVSRDCLLCGTPVRNQWAARGYCAECEGGEKGAFTLQPLPGRHPATEYYGVRKSRTVSVGLALVLGGFGAHKFYLERPGLGFLYLGFFWTGIPALVGIFEAVKYIRMEEEEFHNRFLRGKL